MMPVSKTLKGVNEEVVGLATTCQIRQARPALDLFVIGQVEWPLGPDCIHDKFRITGIGNGTEGAGPGGITADKSLSVSVGKPLAINVWAIDDGKYSGSTYATGEAGLPVNLTWSKHQGPGDVIFSANGQDIPYSGGEATTMVTFTMPGDYIIRVRGSDASGIDKAGHAQCCWTNGFVNVAVSQ